jgi:hypothetical protein
MKAKGLPVCVALLSKLGGKTSTGAIVTGKGAVRLLVRVGRSWSGVAMITEARRSDFAGGVWGTAMGSTLAGLVGSEAETDR